MAYVRCARVDETRCPGETVVRSMIDIVPCPRCGARIDPSKGVVFGKVRFQRNLRALFGWLHARLERNGRVVSVVRPGVFATDGQLVMIIDAHASDVATAPVAKPALVLLAGESHALGSDWRDAPWVTAVEAVLEPERSFEPLLARSLEDVETPLVDHGGTSRTWADATMSFLNGEVLRIQSPWLGRRTFSAAELGMVTATTKSPTTRFRYLELLCENGGELTSSAVDAAWPAFIAQIKLLKRDLARLGFVDSPFEPLRNGQPVVARFRVPRVRRADGATDSILYSR